MIIGLLINRKHMNKKIVTGIVGLVAVVGVAGLVASTTYAKGGESRGGMMRNATSTEAIAAQRDAMVAHQEGVNKAIEAGDYVAWKAAMSTFTNGRGNDMTTVITEANFAKFAEMHKLMKQADAIRKEIGLDKNDNVGPGMSGRGRGMMGLHQSTGTVSTNK